MQFKTEIRTRTVPRTIDGVTHDITEKYIVQVPRSPRDWDGPATRAAAGIVLALTGVAVVWSTVSIGGLLGGGVGYAAAVVFDLSWLVALLVGWLARFDARKRKFPEVAGWVLVAVAAAAIFTHGALEEDWALAGIGAAVSVVSKVLWLVVMKFIDREISEEDAEWMRAEISAVNAKEAIATVRLRAAAAEERAALRLLQAERIRGQVDAVRATEHAAFANTNSAEQDLFALANNVEPSAAEIPEPAANVPLNSTNTVPEVRERAVPSIAELARRQVAVGADVEQAVAAILAEHPGLNRGSVAATVRRERRKAEGSGGAGYL